LRRALIGDESVGELVGQGRPTEVAHDRQHQVDVRKGATRGPDRPVADHHFVDDDVGGGRDAGKIRAEPPCRHATSLIQQTGDAKDEHGCARGCDVGATATGRLQPSRGGAHVRGTKSVGDLLWIGGTQAGRDDHIARPCARQRMSRGGQPAAQDNTAFRRHEPQVEDWFAVDSIGCVDNVDRGAYCAGACPIEDKNIDTDHVANYARKLSVLPLALGHGLSEDRVMPLLRVTLTPGAFDDAQKARLVAALTEAACRAESVPDRPESRMRALVLLAELAPGCFCSAGVAADAGVAGVFIDWQVSTGVLDGARKARFAQDLQEAAQSAADTHGSRTVVTSCVIHEVPEGQWAQNGTIRRLPEVASMAGFEHLAPIASRG